MKEGSKTQADSGFVQLSDKFNQFQFNPATEDEVNAVETKMIHVGWQQLKQRWKG